MKTKKTTPRTESPKKVAVPKTTAPAAKCVSTEKEPLAFVAHAGVDSKVFLAGSFNNWDPSATEMADRKGDGVFIASVRLPAGKHEYKFVVDGTWLADSECKASVANAFGTLNSVIEV